MSRYLQDALQENVVEFLSKWSDDEVLTLAFFLGGEYELTPIPSDKIKLFITEFIGDEKYATFYVDLVKKEGNVYFTSAFQTQALMSELYGYVSFQVLCRVRNKIKPKTNTLSNFKNKLKKDLDVAFDNSFDGSNFDKIEGFLNIMDVLEEHKVITHRDDRT